MAQVVVVIEPNADSQFAASREVFLCDDWKCALDVVTMTARADDPGKVTMYSVTHA